MTKIVFIPLLVICCLPFGSTAMFAQEQAPGAVQEGKLYWNNGDSLVGSIISADSQKIVWKSPFFVEPLQIGIDVLSTIRFDAPEPDAESRQTFRVVMQNGDVLFGNLKAITASNLVIESDRHGTITLKRNKIRTLRRISSSTSTYLGPQGLDGWRALEEANKGRAINVPGGGGFGGAGAANTAKVVIPPWNELSDGRISTSKNSGLYRELNFPDRCEIEFVLESKKVPAFSLMLGKNKNGSLRLESWEATLVALSGYDFVELTLHNKDQRKVHLHLFLDKQKKQLAIYSHSGTKLGEVDGSKSTSDLDGIYLHNDGDDLTLNYLRVDPWNGDFPQPLRPGESRVQLKDGSIQYGKLLKVVPETKSIRFGSPEAETSIPIDTVSSITLLEGQDKEMEGQDKENREDKLQVSWRDGGRISGLLHQVAGSQIEVSTDYCEKLIVSELTDVLKISLPQIGSEKKKSETPDKVFFSGGTLRGHLMIENQSPAPIKWKPVGGVNSSELSAQGKAKFVRGNRHPDLMFDVNEFPDVLFLKNNDVLPCRLNNLTEKTIEIAFPMSDAKQVPLHQVKAIEFASSQRATKKDFTDKKWTTTGSSKLSADKALLPSGNCTVANPEILTGDDIQFQLDWVPNQYAKMTVFLNCDNVLNSKQYDSKTVTAIEINTSGESLWITKGTPQQQGVHFFGRMQQGNQRVIPCAGAKARIRLITRDGAVHVSVNDNEVFSAPLNRNGAQEKGIFFSASIMGARSSGGKKRSHGNGVERGFRISHFEVNSVAGSAVKQYILEESRQRTLMIPRFRRDDPPTHIVIAPNGDLLRGRLIRVDEDQVLFESKLEVFRFERERIASIIWLPKPVADQKDEQQQKEEKAEKPAEVPKKNPSEIQLRLAHGYCLSMEPQMAQSDKLQGRSSILGECAIPSASIKELILGNMQSDSYDIFSQWVPHSAPEPEWDLPDSDSSGQQLVGTVAKNFVLPMLDGSTFKLTDHADKVVVLDFWATWCGPCILALPGYIDATSQFDSKKVIFVTVNLREASQPVRQFLARENLSPPVALDSTGEIASQFGVSGIPHTVIISPGGTIESVKVGYDPTAAGTMKETISKILDGSWKREEVPKKETSSEEPAL